MNTPKDASDTAINRLADLEELDLSTDLPLVTDEIAAADIAIERAAAEQQREELEQPPVRDPALSILDTTRTPHELAYLAKQRADIERFARHFCVLDRELLDYIELCLSSCYTEGWLERSKQS